jgi:hypothetical protein
MRVCVILYLSTKGGGKMRHNNQKLKCYLVYRYLFEQSDENNRKKMKDIVSYLKTNYGIEAERKSIYNDIRDINVLLYHFDTENESIQQTEEEIAEYEEEGDDCWKTIVYTGSGREYYVRNREYNLDDIRTIATCIYSAKFITERQAQSYVNMILNTLVSEHQAKEIRQDAFLVDRGKTINKNVFYNIQTISDAMRTTSGKNKHTPKKISFKYVSATIKGDAAERRKGAKYIVNPFRLLINDGYYYLLGVEDTKKKIMTYRVDRMKDVVELKEEREHAELFRTIDEKTYAKQHFGMFNGAKERVTLRFSNHMLDTVVDKFGREGHYYYQVDEKHFSVQVEVAVTDQFFGWLCSLGRAVKIISPPPVLEKYKEHLEKIRDMY